MGLINRVKGYLEMVNRYDWDSIEPGKGAWFRMNCHWLRLKYGISVEQYFAMELY